MNAIFDIHGKPLTNAFRGGIGAAIAHASDAKVTLSNADLRDVALSEIYFGGLNMGNCDASRALFAGCRFESTNLANATLQKTYFNGSSLFCVDFKNAQLQEASFAHCRLSEINFEIADLSSVDFREARITGNIYLSNALVSNPHHWVYWSDTSSGQFACLDDQIRRNGDRTATFDEWFHYAAGIPIRSQRARLIAALTHLQHQRNLWALHEFRPRVQCDTLNPSPDQCADQSAHPAG